MLPVLDYKRIILAILIVVIGLGLIIGMIWLLFLRTPEEIIPVNVNISPGGELPGTGTGGEPGVVGLAGEQ